MEALYGFLVSADFRVAINEKYHINALTGEREARVVEQIFFCSSLMITLARRFISNWMLQTDATFNTNRLRLPLSVITGVTNTGKTFPAGLCFTMSESAEAFNFMDAQMNVLMWYDCPGPRVALGDQAKGLVSSMESQAAKRRDEGKDHIILQLCEKHAASNMETRVRRAGKYNKDKVKEITNQIWAYIQAGSIELLDTARETLLRSLYLKERTYLEKN